MVALNTSFVLAAVVLGAVSSIYAAPTPFNADLVIRGFENNDSLEARFFNDEADLENRNFEDDEEIFARDFDEEGPFARGYSDDDDHFYAMPSRYGNGHASGHRVHDDERHPSQHIYDNSQHTHQRERRPSQHHPHVNSMRPTLNTAMPIKLHARSGQKPTMYIGTPQDVAFTHLKTGTTGKSGHHNIHAHVDEIDEALVHSNSKYILSSGGKSTHGVKGAKKA